MPARTTRTAATIAILFGLVVQIAVQGEHVAKHGAVLPG
jgi:hypothetical protein